MYEVKTRQVLKLADTSGKYTVIYHENDKVTPYWVYKHTWVQTEHGWYRESKRLEVKYTDLRSCLYHIADHIEHNL